MKANKILLIILISIVIIISSIFMIKLFTKKCKTNKDCGDGKECNKNNKCVPSNTPKPDPNKCDPECGKDQVCKEGKCVDPKPDPNKCDPECNKDQVCKEGKCVDHKPEPKPDPNKCDPECNEDQVCVIDQHNGNKCYNKYECTEKIHCPEGKICVNNKCEEPPKPECTTDKDCGSKNKMKCFQNKCKKVECRNMNDCQDIYTGNYKVCNSDYKCENCTNDKQCVLPDGSKGICFDGRFNVGGYCAEPECNTTSDCKDGKICSTKGGGGGRCTSCTSGDCNEGEVCKSGRCVKIECKNNSDCKTEGLICNNNMCVNCSNNIKCPEGQNCVNGFCGDYTSGYKFISGSIAQISQNENQNPNDCLNLCKKNKDCHYWDLTKDTTDISKIKYSCNLYNENSCSIKWNESIACHKDTPNKICGVTSCNIPIKKLDGKFNKKCKNKLDCYDKLLDGLSCEAKGKDSNKYCYSKNKEQGTCQYPPGKGSSDSDPDDPKTDCINNGGTWTPNTCNDVTECTEGLYNFDCNQGECIDTLDVTKCKNDNDCGENNKCTTDNYCQGPNGSFPSMNLFSSINGVPTCSGEDFDFPQQFAYETLDKMTESCKGKQKGSDCIFTDFSDDNKVVYAKCDTINVYDKKLNVCAPDICLVTKDTTFENPKGICSKYANVWNK